MKSGQTLVLLLVFMSIAIVVTTASVAVIITNSQGASGFEQGQVAYDIAESGAENAMLRIIRSPSYAGESDLTIDGGTATITVTGSDPKTIISEGRYNNFVRKIEVISGYAQGVLTVQSWREIY